MYPPPPHTHTYNHRCQLAEQLMAVCVWTMRTSLPFTAANMALTLPHKTLSTSMEPYDYYDLVIIDENIMCISECYESHDEVGLLSATR